MGMEGKLVPRKPGEGERNSVRWGLVRCFRLTLSTEKLPEGDGTDVT